MIFNEIKLKLAQAVSAVAGQICAVVRFCLAAKNRENTPLLIRNPSPELLRFDSNFSRLSAFCREMLAFLVGAAVLFSAPVFAASGGGYSEYYVPGTEQQVYDSLHDIRPANVTDPAQMRGGVSITAGADNTVIYYDHWENGYAADPIASPDLVINLNEGDISILQSSSIDPAHTGIFDCVVENGPANDGSCFDGRDRFYTVGGAVTVNRVIWNEQTSTYFQVAWEVYPVKALGSDVISPFGEDLATASGTRPAFPDFKRSYLLAMAVEDGSMVSINGAAAVPLSKGQTISIPNNNTGASIIEVNGRPLYGLAIVGDQDETYEARGFTIVPQTYWNSSYYAPAHSTTGQGGSPDLGNEIYLYNPNAADITVSYEDSQGNGTFTVEAGETHSYSEKAGHYVPTDSAVYMSGSDNFWGVVSVDTQSSSWDWGHALIPDYYLKDEYLIGWAPGSLDRTQNGSPLYITPAQNNTDVFIDYAPHDGIPDQTFNLNRLDSQTIYDTAAPFDLSGARVWATGPIAVVYGEQAANGSSGSNYLDLGYTTLPLRDEWLNLAYSLHKEQNRSVVSTAAGQVVTFTLEMHSFNDTMENIDAIDLLPVGWSYVPGSASIVLANGSIIAPGSAEPVISGQELRWGVGTAVNLGTLGVTEAIRISYDTITNVDFPVNSTSTNFAESNATAVIGGQPFVATDLAHVTFVALGMCFAVADGGVDSDGSGNSGAEDTLLMVNPVDGSVTFVGNTTTFNIEGIAFVPDFGGGYTLYSVNDSGTGQFGTLSLSNGVFTQIGTGIGTGNGSAGAVVLSDVDALSYDVTTDTMYGVVRSAGLDRLIQIDLVSGSYVPDAFGAGIDYVEVPATASGEDDVDDIAVDPYTGALYAAINSGGTGGTLVILDKSTGQISSEIGAFGEDDIEGMAFFNDGSLYGSSGDSNNSDFFLINQSTGAATNVGPMLGYHDYEALGCLTVVGQSLGNTIFDDLSQNSTFDPGEELAGALVELFQADGVSPAFDFTGNVVTAVTTLADGQYQFDNLPSGDYIVQVTPPVDYVPATVQVVNPNSDVDNDSNIATQPSPGVYQGGIVTLTVNGEPGSGVDGDHASANQTLDFGFIRSADLQLTKTASPIPVQVGQNLTYTLTVNNNGPVNATGVVVTDVLPAGVTHVSTVPSQGACSDPTGVVCELGAIANGASATVTIIVTVN